MLLTSLLEKFDTQTSEESLSSYYVNAEVWCSDRLRKDKNIYTNRYKDTSKRFRGFWHLMGQWKGSVIKLIYHDLIVFITFYMVINIFYRFYLYENGKRCNVRSGYSSEYCTVLIARQWFEYFCVYCGR